MKKLYKKPDSGKLAAYSAMAVAFIAAGSRAEASVVYNDISDVTLQDGDAPYFMDLDGDGANDFLFFVHYNLLSVTTTGGSMYSIPNSYGKVFGWITTSVYAFGQSSNQVVGYQGAFYPYGSALNNGDNIGPSQSFNPYFEAWLASTFNGSIYGPFANQTDKYLGVKFIGGDGGLHYGWLRLDATVNPVTLTIKDFAYETTPNTPTYAGSGVTGIPAIMENQVSAYSFGKTIYVNTTNLNAKHATVDVFNVSGQKVYNNMLDQSGMQIALQNAASGMYTLRIEADGAVYNKELYIGE